jgi:hypothetical protein
MLNNFRTSRAITTLLNEQSATSAEGKQALQSLRKIGSPAIPKLIEALSLRQNTAILESLLFSFLDNQSLPAYLQALANSDQ